MNLVIWLLVGLLIAILIISILSFMLKTTKILLWGSAFIISASIIIWAFLKMIGIL